MAQTVDSIIIGSGINGLVCAAILARKGQKVCLIERESELGGCIRSGEITLPGYVHDILSGFHPLFVTSPGYAALATDLHARGLEYGNVAHPTGVVMGDGRSLIMERSRYANIARFNSLIAGDGDAFAAAMQEVETNANLTFSLLGNDLWTGAMARKLAKEAWTRGLSGLASYFGDAMVSCRDWLNSDFKSDLVRALLAPWVLHTGLDPDQSVSGMMGKVVPCQHQWHRFEVVI